MFNIMVVEDDKNTMRLMETVLVQNGYNAIPACDSEEALALMDKKQIDLIVLDVMLPGIDGFQLTKMMREGGCEIPVLMVTARETPADKRAGFLAGTDDYMVKPVDEEEMILRINALLRRAKIASERCIIVGHTKLSYDSMTVEQNGESAELPQKEFLLIFKLLSYQNKVFTRRQLMDELWDMDSETDERTVDVHINRLRERFKNNSDFEIITVRGLGYKAVAR